MKNGVFGRLEVFGKRKINQHNDTVGGRNKFPWSFFANNSVPLRRIWTKLDGLFSAGFPARVSGHPGGTKMIRKLNKYREI